DLSSFHNGLGEQRSAKLTYKPEPLVLSPVKPGASRQSGLTRVRVSFHLGKDWPTDTVWSSTLVAATTEENDQPVPSAKVAELHVRLNVDREATSNAVDGGPVA